MRRRSPRFHSFNINAVKPDGYKAGHTALSLCLDYSTEATETGANRNKTAVVNLLINQGVNVHMRIITNAECNNTMLHIACKNNNPLNIVQTLLNNGLSATITNDRNQTPLHFASRCNNADVMSLLIDYRADVNAVDVNGDTPFTFLMKAFYKVFHINCRIKLRNIENCMDLLLHNGANINQVGKSGFSSFFLVVHGLNTMGFSTDIKLEYLRKMINAGADTNMVFTGRSNMIYINGDTPLHAAAYSGANDVVRFLLLHNPDVNRGNILNQTASDYAKRFGYDGIHEEILFHIRKNNYKYFYNKPFHQIT
jgi:ankyrin repeat protein